MTSTLLDGMNAEQTLVVCHRAGPLLVAAGAGCGKTRVLTHRVASLVDDGADPTRILAVTFSVKAAKEMNERLAKLDCAGSRVSTFHSLSLQIVREEIPEYRQWQIDDSDRYRICVKDAVSYRYMRWSSADVTHLLSYIGRCKAAGARPESPIAAALAEEMYKRKPTAGRQPSLCREAYKTAELIRRDRQLLTFDCMLIEAYELFARDEQARQRWAAKWDHVLQDECQDENFVQHEIASMLARDHKSYMIVGDPAQSIYKFRGANPQAMLSFEADWKATVIRMGRNYRSGDLIVELANKSLDAMPPNTHLGVRMLAERGEPGEVSAVVYDDLDAEGEGVTERILESHEDGRAWGAHVVLFRTNAQSRCVEESCLSARVPYRMIGGTNFYDRREVKDLLAYLRVGEGRGSFDDIRRSINTPFRYLGKAFVDSLESVVASSRGDVDMIDLVRSYVGSSTRLQQRQRTTALEYCELICNVGRAITKGKDAPTESEEHTASLPSRILENLVADLRYSEWLTRDEGMESPENNRVSNVRELIRASTRFRSVSDLLDYVDDTLARAARAKREGGSSDVVTLCSIHRSKGLEWPVVFVLGCNEKILPHANAEDVDEERRLFYVACTRARDVLQLSCVAEAVVSNRLLPLTASRFLTEVGIDVEPAPAASERGQLLLLETA